LAGISDRSAHFTCTLVFLESDIDPEPLIAVGKWYGDIIDTPRGSAGFGYDPHFFIPSLNKSAAELSAEEKNAISHRGLAMQDLIAQLQRKFKQ